MGLFGAKAARGQVPGETDAPAAAYVRRRERASVVPFTTMEVKVAKA